MSKSANPVIESHSSAEHSQLKRRLQRLQLYPQLVVSHLELLPTFHLILLNFLSIPFQLKQAPVHCIIISKLSN